MADNDCKGATACGRGTAAFGGLLGNWSRQGVEQTNRHAFAGFSFHARHPSFGSMVSHQKGRWYFSESQADYRLSSGQQVFALPSFQNGSLGPNFSFPAGRDVGLQNRSERCLLSPTFGNQFATVFGAPGGRPIVSVSSGPIWSKPSAIFVDHTNEDVHQDLATAGSSGFCYLDDILLVGKTPYS